MATAQISLIRLHTEKIRPPRALWVPFELGRPFGAPSPAFQRKVLLAALKLFEEPNGPVIRDFPEDAPSAADNATVLSCPLPPAGNDSTLDESERIGAALHREMVGMRSWYDLSCARRQRTTVGVSGLDPDQIETLLSSFVRGVIPANPRTDIPLSFTLKLAVDDLKAYYYEALLAQPANESLSPGQILDWFWEETAASQAIFAIRDVCLKSGDGMLKPVAKGLMIPTEKSRPKSS